MIKVGKRYRLNTNEHMLYNNGEVLVALQNSSNPWCIREELFTDDLIGNALAWHTSPDIWPVLCGDLEELVDESIKITIEEWPDKYVYEQFCLHDPNLIGVDVLKRMVRYLETVITSKEEK